MNLINKDEIEFARLKQTILAVIKEDIEELPTVKAIPLDNVKKAREVIENLTPWDEGTVEMYDVLEILDKLIESEDM